MKIFTIIIGTFALLIGALYALLFTAPGNKIVAPFVEKQINASLPLTTTLETFELGIDRFKIIVQLTPANRVEAEGDYDIFKQSLLGAYRLRFEDLRELEPLTTETLYGSFGLDGEIVGTQQELQVTGNSDLAEGATAFDATLKNLAPASVVVSAKHLHVDLLQKMLGKEALLHGLLDLDAKLKNLDPKQLDGVVTLNLSNGMIERAIVKRDYGLSLPDASFDAGADALLEGDTIRYDLKVRSALARIDSKGTVVPESLALDLRYDLTLKELGLLEALTPIPMRGSVATKGSVTGNRDSMRVVGNADLAGSDTRYDLKLETLAPRSLSAEVKDGSVAKLLHMLKQPHYADGKINLTVDIPDARSGRLQGTVKSSVTEGVVDGKTVSKRFDFLPMPKTTFATETFTTLEKNRATTRSNIRSTLADVTGKAATVDLDTGYVRADYRIDLHDLDRLYFLTERHLEGAITLTGDVVKEKDLDITTHADTLGGTLDITMHNDDIHAVGKSLKTLETLKMLTYPQMFDAAMNATFDYNVIKQSGSFKADLKQGVFTRNAMIDLVKKAAGMNLYKERFNGTIESAIVKEQVTTALDLKANTSSIGGKNILLDTKRRIVNAKLDVVANNNPIGVKIKGSVDKPELSIDVSKLAEKEAKKAVEKELNKLLRKLF